MFKRILFPVDFSSASENALVAGFSIAERCRSEVHVIHVLTRKKHQSYFAAEGVGVAYHEKLEQEKLDRLVVHIDPKAVREVVYGLSVTEEVLRYAMYALAG